MQMEQMETIPAHPSDIITRELDEEGEVVQSHDGRDDEAGTAGGEGEGNAAGTTESSSSPATRTSSATARKNEKLSTPARPPNAAAAMLSPGASSPFAHQEALCPTPPASAALSPGTTTMALKKATALPYCLYAAGENPLSLPTRVTTTTHSGLRSVGLPQPTSPGSDATRDEVAALLNRMCHAAAYRSVMREHSELREETTAFEYKWRQQWIEDAPIIMRPSAASGKGAAGTAGEGKPRGSENGTSTAAGAASLSQRKVSTGRRRASVGGSAQTRQLVSTSSARPARRMSLDERGSIGASNGGGGGGGMGVVVQGNAKLRAEVAAIKTKLRGALGRGDRHAAAAAVLELAQLEPEMRAAVKNGGGGISSHATPHLGNSVAISNTRTGVGGSSHHLSEESINRSSTGVSLVGRSDKVYNRAKSLPQPPGIDIDGESGSGERRAQHQCESHLSIESKSKPICLVRRTNEGTSSESQSAALARSRRYSESGGAHKSERHSSDLKEQVPGQFSYPASSPFDGGGSQWQRRMLELQALQSESVKWEREKNDSKGGNNAVVALVSNVQSTVPSNSFSNEKSLPLWR